MDWKIYLLGTYTAITIIKDMWEVFSDKPLITGAFNLATFLSNHWLLVVSIPIFLLVFFPLMWDRIKGLEKIFNRHFSNETVVIDGKHFIDCTIHNCTISWNGGNFTFDNVKAGVYHLHSENDIVVRTINLLKGLGALEENFAKNIRRVPKGK